MASKKKTENSKKQAAASKRQQSKTAKSAPMRIPRPYSGLVGKGGGMAPQAAAAAYARGQRSAEPRIRGSFRSTRIVHRELVASITGSSSFAVANTFALNPGLAATFPWLSTQALGWEQYKFHKLRFCYYSRCSTATPGSMMLVPDYDAADAQPTTEIVASAYRDVVEEVPWVTEFCCDLDPKAMIEPGDRKYVRTQALAANLDVKTYDSGQMFVCTTDGSATNWGKLWVEYDVEFFVPQLPPSGVTYTPSSQTIQAAGGSISASAIYGAAATSVGPAWASAEAGLNVLTFNYPGYYYIFTSVGGTGGVSAAYSANTFGSASVLGTGTTSTTLGFYSIAVDCTAAGQTLTSGSAEIVTGSSTLITPITAAQYAVMIAP
jgi:hypothetical protein